MADAPDVDKLMEIENPSFGQVPTCVFGIRSHESRAHLILFDSPGSTAVELAEVPDRDRSNVNRSLTTLLDKSLTKRKRRLLDLGSYVYQYTTTSFPRAKEMMHATLGE